MEVRELEQAEYERKLRTVIAGTEGLHAHVQDAGDERATIGWGYILNRDNNVEIWRRSGIELTRAQRETLERVDQAPRGEKTRVGMGFDRILTEAEADRLFAASLREYERPAISAGLQLSDERVALVSVTYNRGVGALRDHPLLDALPEGDRAAAWYQLRYNCWGSREDMEGGLRKRRFAESEVLGLYDDPANVSVKEAAGVYAMYRTHRLEIDRVERAFGEAIDGTRARPDRIAQANRDYPDIVAEYGTCARSRSRSRPHAPSCSNTCASGMPGRRMLSPKMHSMPARSISGDSRRTWRAEGRTANRFCGAPPTTVAGKSERLDVTAPRSPVLAPFPTLTSTGSPRRCPPTTLPLPTAC